MKTSTRRVSLRDTAYEEIRRRIVTCELRPGQTLTVSELSDALDIGRTPVIQAVDRLAVDGLIDVLPRKGMVVSPVGLDDFMEIVEMRLLNEGRAARWAAEKAATSDVVLLRRNLTSILEANDAGKLEEFIALDGEFHRLITQIAGNRILSDVLANLHDKSLRFWFISLRAPDHHLRVARQHESIIEAIAAGDPEAAEAAMCDHIASFQMNATRQITRG